MKTLTLSTSGSRSVSVARPTHEERLKMNVRRQLASEWRHLLPQALVWRAVDEAEQVAAKTGFPALFLPELAAEQVRRLTAFVSSDYLSA